MGWAKYYEDNMSVLNNRLLFKNAENQEYLISEQPVKKAVKAVRSPKKARAGLEIHFFEAVDNIDARKLQINGWWWSKYNNCWCNYNTEINRAFAEHLLYKINIITVA